MEEARSTSSMDEAAVRAAQEFGDLEKSDPQAVEMVRAWWRKHYLQAGHRRLARILLGRSPSGRN